MAHPMHPADNAVRTSHTKKESHASKSHASNATTIVKERVANNATDVSRVAIPTIAMEENVEKQTILNRNKATAAIMCRRLRAAISVLLLVVTLTSCSPDGAFYSDFKSISSKGWGKSESLEFALPDSTCHRNRYDIQLSVRHDNYYAYKELWLRVDYQKGHNVERSDTVKVILTDDYGNRVGSGLGKLFQVSTAIAEGVTVGEYDKVVVWHEMKADVVTHVTDIGLTYFDNK